MTFSKTALLLALGAGLAWSGQALASEFSGGTLKVEAPERQFTLTLAGDGTYQSTEGNAGTWTYANGEMCLIQKQPEEKEPFCGPYDGSRQPGESWTAQAWDGSGEITLTLEK